MKKKKSLQYALKSYFEKDIWKDCGVAFTRERDDFILGVLKKKINEITTKKAMQALVFSIPYLDEFHLMFSFRNEYKLETLKRILIQYMFSLHPSRVSFTANFKGCNEVFWYKLKDRNQFIYMIGEDHDVKGNSLDILKQFSQNISCPIDILVEKGFDTYFKEKPVRTHSNVTQFGYPPLNVCSDKGSVPKPAQIHKPRFEKYLLNCVLPMKGRVKIWAIDIRQTSIFHLVNRPSNNVTYRMGFKTLLPKLRQNEQYKKWYNSVVNFQKGVYDFDLAEKNMISYDKTVKDLLFSVYRNIPKSAPWYPKLSLERLKEVIQEILQTTDKTHIHFARAVLQFPRELRNKWKEMCLKEIEKDSPNLKALFMSTLHDINGMIRLYRILKTQKEGIILFFSGSAHTHHMATLLNSDDRFEILAFLQSTGDDRHVNLPIPRIPCKEKTQLMKMYQSMDPSSLKQ